MNARWMLAAWILFLSREPTFCQEKVPPPPPEALFQEAWFREVAEGRFEEALAAYEGLASRPDLPASLRARALFRAGVTLGKLQRPEEARKAFERIPAEFPGEEEVVSRARREIQGETEADASLRKKVESLVGLLGDKDAKVRSNARDALAGIGPKAAGPLLAALGGGDYYAVEAAAYVLVRLAVQDSEIAPSLLGALRSGDTVVRDALTTALGAFREEPWPRILGELLRDKDPEVRLRAVRTLGPWKDRSLVESFQELVADSVPSVRIEAVGALSEYRDPTLQPAFAKALGDPEESVRVAALKAVARPPPGPASPVSSPVQFDVASVLPMLADPSSAVVSAAVAALLKATPPKEARDARSIFPDTPQSAEALKQLGKLALDQGLSLSTRLDAVRILGGSRRPDAYPHLAEIARSSIPDVAGTAIEGIGRLEAPAAVRFLMDLATGSRDAATRDKAWSVLRSDYLGPELIALAVERLPELGDKAAEAIGFFSWEERTDLALQVLPHYDSLNAAARERILLALRGALKSRPGLPEALPVIQRGLVDRELKVRRTAVMVAGGCKPEPQSVPALIQALGVEDRDLRWLSIDALTNIGDARAVPALIPLLMEADSDLTSKARDALFRLGAAGQGARVVEVLVDPSNPRPERALEVLKVCASASDAPALAQVLERVRSDLRASALEIVGNLKSPEAVAFLRPWLGDKDSDVRTRCAWAIGECGAGGAVPDLVRALADPESTVRLSAAQALARAEPARILAEEKALPALGKALEDRDFGVRDAVVDVLASLKDPRAIPLLIDALKEGDSRPEPNPAEPRGDKPGQPRAIPPRTVASPSRTGRAPGVRMPSPAGALASRPPGPAGSPSIAEKASEALVAFGDRSVVAAMLEILQGPLEKNPWLQPELGLKVLKQHAAADDAPILAQATEKLPPEVCAKFLADLGGPLKACKDAPAVVVPHLVKLLGSEDLGVRTNSAGLLGSIRGDLALRGLLEALAREEDENALARIAAAIASFQDPKTIPDILRAARREGGAGAMAVRSLTSYPVEQAIGALEAILAGEYPVRCRTVAVEALVRVEHPRALELLLAQTGSPERNVRNTAAYVLGTVYDGRVLPKLVDLLKDPEEEVRKTARESLEKVRYYLEQERFAAEAGKGQEALAEILAMLRDPSPAVRLAAVKAVSKLKARDALPALLPLRKDDDAEVRKAAEAALDALAESAALGKGPGGSKDSR
jgi:HEAT repeat protein